MGRSGGRVMNSPIILATLLCGTLVACSGSTALFRERRFTGVPVLGLYFSSNPNLKSRHQYSCDYLATYIFERPLLVRPHDARSSRYVHINRRRN